MIICEHCFDDIELKTIVSSHKQTGKCEICGQSAYVYDTENNDSLIDTIDEFMNMYKRADDSIAPQYRLNLEYELIHRWNIFSKACSYNVKKIIRAIYSFSEETKERFDISLFDNDVYIPYSIDNDYLNEHSILKDKSWYDFTYGIKHVNRYHSDILNKKQLDAFLEPLATDFNIDQVFCRSRISGKEGFSQKEMGIPPLEKARAGRIGAEGIPCFYLANDVDTSIKEVRAGAFDYVTVAKYKIIKPLRVIDLRLLDHISPFSISEPAALAINRETLFRIKTEVEKPVRVTENNIEYVPIQFICDYIRSKGYDGIVYNSTMSAKGFNLSAFSASNFKYISKSVYYVKDISVSTEKSNATKG